MKPIVVSWSGGKDSAWTLYQLLQNPEFKVVGLVTTYNEKYQRSAMHAIRTELVQQQAQAIGLPLELIPLPDPCSNKEYEKRMSAYIDRLTTHKIYHIAFGDLFLQDIRDYREEKLKQTSVTPLFPLWQLPTDKLARTMLAAGIKAKLTCVDPKQIDKTFAGREFDHNLLNDLPKRADPCGENGEFHTLVYDAPMFSKVINVQQQGDIIIRDGFAYRDFILQH